MGDRWNEGRGSAVAPRGRGKEFVRQTEVEMEEKGKEDEEGACGPECRLAELPSSAHLPYIGQHQLTEWRHQGPLEFLTWVFKLIQLLSLTIPNFMKPNPLTGYFCPIRAH